MWMVRGVSCWEPFFKITPLHNALVSTSSGAGLSNKQGPRKKPMRIAPTKVILIMSPAKRRQGRGQREASLLLVLLVLVSPASRLLLVLVLLVVSPSGRIFQLMPRKRRRRRKSVVSITKRSRLSNSHPRSCSQPYPRLPHSQPYHHRSCSKPYPRRPHSQPYHRRSSRQPHSLCNHRSCRP